MRTGVSPSTPRLSRRLPLTTLLFDSLSARQLRLVGPTTPYMQRLPAITQVRFGLFRFRSPLLAESRLFSLPAGTEMFHFPAFPPLTLCVQVRVTAHDCCRVSPFGHPWISARLAAPQGLSQPPTSFIGSWCQGIHRMPLLTWPQRCSRPLCSSQGTDGAATVSIACRRLPVVRCGDGPRGEAPSTPVPSGPNSVPTTVHSGRTFHTSPEQDRQYLTRSERTSRTSQRSTHERPRQNVRLTSGSGRPTAARMLLRKEVIQPHLPVRLPCYDFVPIASPTFDGSLLAVGPPASGVTDFRDVTGGVYKARERIHRSVADLRLLATPTSRGRVADPDPN